MNYSGRCYLVLMLLCSGLFIAPAWAGLPFSPGERIHYKVRWQMYKAGQAEVRVLPREDASQPYRFELRMKTNGFLDMFFKVRDHLESTVAQDFSGALAYAFTGRGKEKKQIRVAFLKNPDRAAYSNFDEVRDPIEIPPGSFDPLSGYFKMRTLDMAQGQTLAFPITDGKKAFMQKGDVIGKETITLGSRPWKAIVVEPWVTHFSGVFEKSEDPRVRVWISDDAHRIPIRIRIRVVVGSIYFDLEEYQPGTDG